MELRNSGGLLGFGRRIRGFDGWGVTFDCKIALHGYQGSGMRNCKIYGREVEWDFRSVWTLHVSEKMIV